MFQSRLSPIHPFHTNDLASNGNRYRVSISPESHPPFPHLAERYMAAMNKMFQSRLSPIHPFHRYFLARSLHISTFQSRLSPIHPFHIIANTENYFNTIVSISPESHPPFPPREARGTQCYSQVSISPESHPPFPPRMRVPESAVL